jgi:hypothetical protein
MNRGLALVKQAQIFFFVTQISCNGEQVVPERDY